MSQSTSEIIQKYKCLIENMLTYAKKTKPTSLEILEEFKKLWSNQEFIELPEYAKLHLYEFADIRKVLLISEYTILLWDHQGELLIYPLRDGASAYYWLDVVEKREANGTITIIKTPTDKIYCK